MCSIEQAIAAFSPSLPLVIAYSGGADSTALLWHCARKWPGQISAVHVHHGLQEAADGFQRHCENYCTRLGIGLTVLPVNAQAQNGQSPEDAARIARYAAFASLGAPFIALAHHADDQIETFLLALSRGAGLPGLSAMPAARQRQGVLYLRPLLQVGAQDIRDWLHANGIGFVNDPSNQNLQFTRNRIRAQLLPSLRATFPQLDQTLGRSLAHIAQAQVLLDEIAETDFQTICVPPQGPSIRALQVLSKARQGNVLRYWLRLHHQTTPSEAQLSELLQQIAHCTTRGHQIHLKLGRGYVRREGNTLSWYNP